MFGRRRRPQNDFSEELESHLALEVDRLREEGLSDEEAYHAARRNLGNLVTAQERFYESGRWLWFEHLMQDRRHALRRLRNTPAFTLTAVLTVALGVGATTAIFTLVEAVLLKSLPVSNPHQLYCLGKTTHCCVWGGYNQSGEFSLVSYELYKYFRDHTRGFEEMAAFQAGGTFVGVRRARSASPAESYFGEFVSGNYFTMFGVGAYAGRALTKNDDKPGAPPAAIMSYRVWQQKYALDPSAVGGVFNINGKPFTVVGVTPPSFYGDNLRPIGPDFYLPLATEPLVRGESSLLEKADVHWAEHYRTGSSWSERVVH
jgi:hypothetical protein